MARNSSSIESRITKLVLKTVGVETGLYNRKDKAFTENLESEPLYQSNLEIVRSALKSGWVASDLEDFIIQRYKAGERAALLSDILPNKSPKSKVDEDENLLEPGINYQHPFLYLRTPPTFDVRGGLLQIRTSGSIRPGDKFTLADLCDYYFNTFFVEKTEGRWKNALGAFKWLLSDARVDEVLVAMDLAADVKDVCPVLKLADFLEEARQVVGEKESRVK